MPGRSSWNGGWTGEGRNYALVRELSDDQVAKLFARGTRWTHRWSDGWCAEVIARVVPAGEELTKSDGFHGYAWMVDNLLSTGSLYSEVTS
jgi:hypothetical protein